MPGPGGPHGGMHRGAPPPPPPPRMPRGVGCAVPILGILIAAIGAAAAFLF